MNTSELLLADLRRVCPGNFRCSLFTSCMKPDFHWNLAVPRVLLNGVWKVLMLDFYVMNVLVDTKLADSLPMYEFPCSYSFGDENNTNDLTIPTWEYQ